MLFLCVALGDSDRGLHCHRVDIRILSRLVDLAQDEEGPIGLDLDADLRVLDVFLLQLIGDVVGELRGGEARALIGPIKGNATEPLLSTL